MVVNEVNVGSEVFSTDEKEPHLINENVISQEDWNYPKHNIYKIIACFYGFIIVGMGDSSIGVLIPTLESHYNLSYLIVSLAFLSPFTGYTTSAIFSDKLHRLIGRWGVCICGTLCQMTCYIVVSTGPPFPVLVIMYAVAGFGNGLLDSTINSWVGRLFHTNQILGLLHGFYGLGGIICPAIFTAMISCGIKWNFSYFVLIGMCCLSTINFLFAFWGDTAKNYIDEMKEGLAGSESDVEGEQDKEEEEDVEREVGDEFVTAPANSSKIEPGPSVLKQILTNKLVWMLAIDMFLYVGSAVTFVGWLSTFMIHIRHGEESKMGYVTTGAWVGVALGRMVLGFVVGRFQQEDLFVILFTCLSLVCVLIVWLVPVLVVSAIFAALFGFFGGPIYPIIISSAMKKLPKHLHVGGVGFCVAIAGAGAAIPPFINGVITNKYGPKVIGPYSVILLGIMLVLWLVIVKLYGNFKINK